MVYVIVLTYQGPGKNFENNCYTLSFTVNCLNEKAYNLTKTLVDAVTNPLHGEY